MDSVTSVSDLIPAFLGIAAVGVYLAFFLQSPVLAFRFALVLIMSMLAAFLIYSVCCS